MRYVIWPVLFASLSLGLAHGQTLSVRPSGPVQSAPAQPQTPPSATIPLAVPEGTPIKVALDKEVRLRKVGQPLHAKVIEPVYSFDKLVVPAGSEVRGQVSAIDGIPKSRRTMAALDADFSPPRQIHVEFTDLVLKDGRHVSLQTIVTPGTGGVLQFVPANQKEKTGLTARGKKAASSKVSDAKQQARQDWANAKNQIHEPGKMHRLERYAMQQLPVRPQYIDKGTSFNADLQRPLDFGSETVKPEALNAIGTTPPAGGVVHAQLVTPLDSKTTKKGAPVDAVITQPLVVSDKLFLPEGSHIKGSVLQVRPARRLGRNGQLRIVFHQVVPPSGLEEKIEASLEGVAVSKGEHLSLDSEGGAQVTTPRTRYLTTGIAVALAASSVGGDNDRGASAGRGDAGPGAANGASGFKLIGTVVGLLARSRVVTSSFGFYGAGMSVYSHFLARGRDVVYPKDMSMLIGLDTRDPSAATTGAAAELARRPIGPL
jgi:hypothetical protein